MDLALVEKDFSSLDTNKDASPISLFRGTIGLESHCGSPERGETHCSWEDAVRPLYDHFQVVQSENNA